MILIVEDRSESTDFVRTLMLRGYTIRWVNTMDDAVYYIEEKPGYNAFDAVILDMDMPEEGLPDEAIDTARETFTGYAFYKHVLKISPELQEKTIFLSEFTDELKKRISAEKYEKLKLVSKKNKDRLVIIETTLKSWSIKPVFREGNAV